MGVGQGSNFKIIDYIENILKTENQLITFLCGFGKSQKLLLGRFTSVEAETLESEREALGLINFA